VKDGVRRRVFRVSMADLGEARFDAVGARMREERRRSPS
jgi:hypothetical protein